MKILLCTLLLTLFNFSPAITHIKKDVDSPSSFEEILALYTGNKYRKLRVNVKTSCKGVCEFRIVARQDGDIYFIDGISGDKIDRSFLVDTPPETLRFDIKGSGNVSVYVWGD